MINEILVPIDGSPCSEHVLPVALDIARRSGARVHLVQVHEPVVPAAQAIDMPVFDAAFDGELRRHEEQYLLSLANRCARVGVRTRTELLDGAVSEAVARHAAEADIDIIVMTTHGRGGISRAWIGSVADALIRRAAVPVLLVRPRTDQGYWDATLDARHILIPLDGSRLSESALRQALILGGLTGARYTLLRVVPPLPFVTHGTYPIFDQQGTRESLDDAAAYLERIADELRAQGATVAISAVVHGVPAQAILDYAARHDVDAIAMATHGRGGWMRFALGSVADTVMRGTALPIMVYRPLAAERSDVEHYDRAGAHA